MRLLQHVKRFEVFPQWMSWIGETSICEGVRLQQITELVVNARFGQAIKNRQCDAEDKHENGDPEDSPASMRELLHPLFKPIEEIAREIWKHQRDSTNCRQY